MSPHFPPGFHRFCERLRAHGARVYGVGDAPEQALSPQVAAALDGYHFLPNLADVDALEGFARHLMARVGPIHRLDSLNEHWLGVEAELRRRLGVEGQQPEQLAVNRHKIAMTRRFREAGIPCAPGHAVTDWEGLLAFAREVGFPIILKPDVGVGAVGAVKVTGEGQLREVYDSIDCPYLAEAFVTGEVVSFDGLTDAQGNIVFHTAHINCAGVLECRDGELQTWYHSYRDIPPELERLGRAVVAAFDVRERFFHAEFFLKPDGRYQAIEINVRPPGGFTVEMMNFASGVDLYDWWARVVVGKSVPDSYQRLYFAAHVARRRGLRYANQHQTVLTWLGPGLVRYERVPEIFAQAMGDEVFLIRERSLRTLKGDIQFIQSLEDDRASQAP